MNFIGVNQDSQEIVAQEDTLQALLREVEEFSETLESEPIAIFVQIGVAQPSPVVVLG